MNTIPCSICQEGGHHPRSCPALREPLKPGLFAPSGGGGHSHGDDDEKLRANLLKKRSTCQPTLDFPSPWKKPSV